ncbi:MAG TPA: ribonuclease E activity regulator RraA [Steroidobacteraceae bacterium]
MEFKTADLCDQFSDELQVCEPLFRSFGEHLRFGGPIATIKCFEDNSRVRDLVAERGDGRVLVVDAGGSMRRGVLGDQLAQKAVDNGWAGFVIFGCVRDSAAIAQMPIGVRALGTLPMKTDKRGEGQRDLTVQFAGVTFRPGAWVYADEDGIVVAQRALAN